MSSEKKSLVMRKSSSKKMSGKVSKCVPSYFQRLKLRGS